MSAIFLIIRLFLIVNDHKHLNNIKKQSKKPKNTIINVFRKDNKIHL